MRAGERVAEKEYQLLFNVGRDGVLPAIRFAMHLLPLESDHIEEQSLGEPMAAHDAGRELSALLGERDAAVGP